MKKGKLGKALPIAKANGWLAQALPEMYHVVALYFQRRPPEPAHVSRALRSFLSGGRGRVDW